MLAVAALAAGQMSASAWGAIATLTIFVLSNIGLMIYWSAKISTLLGTLQDDVKDIVVELKAARSIYVTKEEFAARIALSDRDHTKIWELLDDVKGAGEFARTHLDVHHEFKR